MHGPLAPGSSQAQTPQPQPPQAEPAPAAASGIIGPKSWGLLPAG